MGGGTSGGTGGEISGGVTGGTTGGVTGGTSGGVTGGTTGGRNFNAINKQPVVVHMIQVPARLYEDGKLSGYGSTLNLMLGAFLPVTAIVSFVGGRYYAGSRQVREVLSDGEI